MREQRRDHRCPECGEMFTARGLRGHRAFKHGISEGRGAGAGAGPEPQDPAPTAPETPAPDDSPAHDPLDEPALEPGAFDDLEDDPDAEPAGTTARPSHVEPTEPVFQRRDFGRAADALLRRADRLGSDALGLEPDPELDDVSELIRPAAEAWGARVGWAFWFAAGALAVLSWVAGKAAQVQRRRRGLVGAAGQATAATDLDADPSPAAGPRRAYGPGGPH